MPVIYRDADVTDCPQKKSDSAQIPPLTPQVLADGSFRSYPGSQHKEKNREK